MHYALLIIIVYQNEYIHVEGLEIDENIIQLQFTRNTIKQHYNIWH